MEDNEQNRQIYGDAIVNAINQIKERLSKVENKHSEFFSDKEDGFNELSKYYSFIATSGSPQIGLQFMDNFGKILPDYIKSDVTNEFNEFFAEKNSK